MFDIILIGFPKENEVALILDIRGIIRNRCPDFLAKDATITWIPSTRISIADVNSKDKPCIHICGTKSTDFNALVKALKSFHADITIQIISDFRPAS